MDCCSSGTSAGAQICPICGSPGRSVEPITVKSLLKASALELMAPGSYRICLQPRCDVVYFTGDHRFLVDDLRVPVLQKERRGARLVCYCFEIREDELDPKAEARIREHVSAGRCACELRNPEGRCCLGHVRALLDGCVRTPLPV